MRKKSLSDEIWQHKAKFVLGHWSEEASWTPQPLGISSKTDVSDPCPHSLLVDFASCRQHSISNTKKVPRDQGSKINSTEELHAHRAVLLLVRFFLVPEWPYPVVVVCEIVQVQQNLMKYRDSIQHKLPSQPWAGDTSHRITRGLRCTCFHWLESPGPSNGCFHGTCIFDYSFQPEITSNTPVVEQVEFIAWRTYCGEVWGVSLRGCWNRFIAGFRFVFIELGALPRAACSWDRLKSMGW